MSSPMKIGKLVFASIAPGLVLFARQWVRTPADAEDIVQEAFVRFWRKQHSPENRALLSLPSVPLPSIYSGATRVELGAKRMHFSTRNKRPLRSFDFDNESQRALADAVGRLPHEQREVVVMKIWNELTFADIGTVLGISQNTAASRYRYALSALKRNLVPHE